jgi:hypothetical protein
MGDGICLYQGDEKVGFLRIERILPRADGVVVFPSHSVTLQTKNGERELTRVSTGECKSVFYDLLWRSGNKETPRLVVETNDRSYYSVLLEHKIHPTMDTVLEVADKLGLEITHERRRKPAFLIRANDEKATRIEQFRGQPKWPDLRTPKNAAEGKSAPLPISHERRKFPNGGVYLGKDDDNTLYFDGVSFKELAQYFEEEGGYPVVSQTRDKLPYCFTLPRDIWMQFSFHRTVPLPGLGLSVKSGEAEVEAILVRDKRADK